ncbi:MAG: glycosyltransferase [Atopobiaceae bacterium]|jgi:glycosyltransferase involved in cell wall biosynthesis|nr:glycosyltransferase [Atopobiaceae bacterium]MCH4180550.1 glycosyltransferase [Atopobiaceae bacterium]MCH4214275.1 glycosyltransferase [Atopobiaceae bacterium]MCH4229428.1 glycosyltransferase [Atopobiaceae bacterium]MCH4276100.1 glycosyltransferase [Atopobiaceae bacterium]
MVIAFVMDDVGTSTNGTAITARRYAQALRAQGHEVRIVAHGATGPYGYPLEERHIPVVSAVSARQSFLFARPDNEVFDRAFAGVDIIHVFLPFKLGGAAVSYARAHGIPVSAAFHLQPENVTYNAWLGGSSAVCSLIYRLFRRWLYDGVRHVHCPSAMIAAQLRDHGYTNELHVISNGVPKEYHPAPATHPFEDGYFHILTVGRLAPEKDQATLVRAVALSRHADRIMLHVAGSGALRPHLRRLGAKLPNGIDIAFHEPDDLIELIRSCDLYVHSAKADIEAISCMEAFSCGVVPVIATSPRSATSQFALMPESLYPVGDEQALADRIDWWLEHPEARAQASVEYVAEGDRYRISACVGRFVDMEREAIDDDLVGYGRQSEVGRARVPAVSGGGTEDGLR